MGKQCELKGALFVMIIGYGIIAVLTGIVTVEIAGSEEARLDAGLGLCLSGARRRRRPLQILRD